MLRVYIYLYIYIYHQTSISLNILLLRDIPPGNRRPGSAASAGASEARGAQSGEAGAQSSASRIRWRSSAWKIGGRWGDVMDGIFGWSVMDDNDNGWTYRDDPGWTYLCEIE